MKRLIQIVYGSAGPYARSIEPVLYTEVRKEMLDSCHMDVYRRCLGTLYYGLALDFRWEVRDSNIVEQG